MSCGWIRATATPMTSFGKYCKTPLADRFRRVASAHDCGRRRTSKQTRRRQRRSASPTGGPHGRGGAAAPQAAPGRRVPPVRHASASTRASPATSPPATPSTPTTSGSTRSACTSATSGVSDLHPASTTTARSSRATRPVNQAAFAIHSQVHAARPDVVAAAHSHSVYGKAWSSLGRLLDPITQDACAFYDDHALFDDYTGVVLDTRGGQAHRARARRQQGRHPAQPRPAHRRPLGRRGRVVVHHDGAVLPGAAARGGRRARRCSSTPTMAKHTAGQVGTHFAGLVQLPAAVRADHPRAARPVRLSSRRPRWSLTQNVEQSIQVVLGVVEVKADADSACAYRRPDARVPELARPTWSGSRRSPKVLAAVAVPYEAA